jgi:oxazoline/thiazoline dehydrogenase
VQPNYTLQLLPEAKVNEDERDILVIHPSGAGLRLTNPDPALRDLIARLMRGGMDRDTLCSESMVACPQGGNASLARLYFSLGEIERKSLVSYTLAQFGRVLATLEPVAPGFCFQDISIHRKFLLSRFAYFRRVHDGILLESPLGRARVVIHDSRCGALLALLTTPRALAELAATIHGLDETMIAAIMKLFISSKAAFACAENDQIDEDDTVPLRQWEFHDLLFHTRSRLGRSIDPWGTTYRFLRELPPLPAVKPRMSERRIMLYKPDLAALELSDLPFSKVVEGRRSVRTPAASPLTAPQLGEFLYRTARVKEIQSASPQLGIPYGTSIRPCANGGAIHELELYLTLARCSGIEPGLYHYDPLAHQLEHVADLGRQQKRLLADACSASARDTPPDALITFAARFQRVTWKYQSIAYATILKNTGALYYQMYLVATAMKLAPCALGAGDSDLFAEATGLDYYSETSVGEFMLSGFLA